MFHVLPVMAAIFDLPYTPMSEIFHTSPTELMHIELVGVHSFGISLLSNVEDLALFHMYSQ